MSIIVTGGSRGIGRAIAKKLAESGEMIVITYRSGTEAAEETKRQIEEKGGHCELMQVDVTSEEGCTEVVKKAAEHGPIKALVNNAGITKDGLAMRMKRDDFEAVIDTNLVGPFLMTKAVLPVMSKQKSGSIVNITSVAGIYGNAGQVNYSSSKAGLIGLTKTIAKEMGGRHIRVNAVAPGFIETEMTAILPEKVKEAALNSIDLRRFGSVEEVAEVVDFLVSDRSSYVTGQIIEVSGGITL